MISRLAVASALGLGVGTVLVLTQFRWGRYRPLTDRLAPYSGTSGAGRSEPPGTSLSLVASLVGDGVDRLAGRRHDLEIRLARTGAAVEPREHRLRQLGGGISGLAAALLAVLVVDPAGPLALAMVSGGFVLGLLWPEHRLDQASRRACREVEQELPLVLEQLATMLDAGLSTQAALQRLADRGGTRCRAGFAAVGARVRQGVSERDALDEWAVVAGVAGATRLTRLLALATPDLGTLLETEARQLRRDAHRRLLEQIERRSQQVWIPVTVATLLPGVLFLSVPFIEAMRLYSSA